ncbi:MAG: hypothetical protein H6555_09355 [Lewinellaceae bacterium]|nr:hypothetical protein [Lewinellaceae bacterium]
MSPFRESGFAVQFDPSWLVQKYDAHRFYRSLSGVGLKGIDFLALRRGEPLLLIELKNYRETPPTPTEVAEAVARKAVDTLRGIRAIQGYFQRKWLYRMLRPWLLRRSWQHSDWVFYAQATARIDAPVPQWELVVILALQSSVAWAPFARELTRLLAEQLGGVTPVSIRVVAGGGVRTGIFIEQTDK